MVAENDGGRKDTLIRLGPEAGERVRRLAYGLSLIEGKRITYGALVDRALEALDRELGISARVAAVTGPAAPPKGKRKG